MKTLEQFINSEIICKVDRLVEHSLNTDGPVKHEDFENLETYPEYRGKYADFDGGSLNDLINEVQDMEDKASWERERGNNAGADAIEDEIDELNDLELEPQEIFEYWLVSPMMFYDLREQGEPVADCEAGYVWGRTETGQSLTLDANLNRAYNRAMQPK